MGTILNAQEVEQEHRYPVLGFDDDGDPYYGDPVVAWTVYVTNEARCSACGWKQRGEGWVDLVRKATLS